MKTNLFLLAPLLIIVFSCNEAKEEKKEIAVKNIDPPSLSIIGTWERTSFYNYREEGKVIDSFQSSAANKHIKIFTPTKVMWCRNNSADLTEWFGYGNYVLSDSLLTETLEYGSKSMNVADDGTSIYEFKYNLEKDKFSQIRFDTEGHPIFAENYIRVE
ncbi:hypothetical protein VOI54_16555 [Tamlana sp. 2201CG12-4]|uniref:hypothetical protein n=1 Tax=Tamlana sp. 2201CG12-4 TaxID=3112582 RepID=UPI002DB62259|nr:hypothetical protein [Tamlana sp. 2201CG12-4]MEC3908641.1 hypothetical protein [Tamlana sp. 2201CG12-4]